MPALVDIKQLSGLMDTDTPNEAIAHGSHRAARNGRFQGNPGNDQWQIIEGNTLLAGQDFLPDGVNKTLYAKYDAVFQRVFYWNYNSNNNHGIYIFNTISKVFQTLLQNGINTDGNILNFSLTSPQESADIIYGDPLDGDLLFFLDGDGTPTKININRFLGNAPFVPYSLIKRSYIDVIKSPPITPPRCVYENDTTVANNNLINSLFQFAYAWFYDDNEKSVICSASIQVLPVNPFSNTQNIDKSKDARIALYLQTGDANVKKLRIYVKQTQNGVKSDWLIVDTIDKSTGGLSDNSIYRFEFFNNGNYTAEDPAYAIQLFDWVPIKAGCQALLNGNVLDYGNITEGYDWLKSTFSYNVVGNNVQNTSTAVNGYLFFADYDGTFTGSQPNVKIFITGAGTNDGSGNPTDVEFAAQYHYVWASSDGTDVSFNILNTFTLNITSILNALKAAAITAGWTFVSQDTNSITIYYPTGTISLKSTFTIGETPTISNFFRLAHYPQSGYSYGVVYFDEDGRTNGVITNVEINVSTLPYNGFGGSTYSEIRLNLNGTTPPKWARSYSVVRTDTLTYAKYLDWISNQAFSNVGQLVVNQYAYIGITNIDDYNEQIQSTANVVNYGFAQGDRIRFVGRFDQNGNFTAINLDYQILGLEINPLLNGTPQIGRFIKIAYPTADIGANFNFINDPTASTYVNFQSYQVEIYNIASNTAPQTENTGTSDTSGNVYYEMGYKFGIGNPGLNTAYHFGNFGDNQVYIQDGDIFYRPRTIPRGCPYYINVSTFAFGNRYATPLIQLPASIITPAYTIAAQNNLPASLNAGSYPQFADGGGLFLNTSGVTRQIRLRGTLQVTSAHPTWMDIYAKIDNSGGTVTVIPIIAKSDPISTLASTSIDITIDAQFGVPSGAKMWLIFGNGESAANLICAAFQLRLDVIDNITIQCFDKSFSDVYNLVTNSDNRPNLQDAQAKQTTFNTYHRWSQKYLPGTVINDTNRFYFQDADELVKQWGPLMRLIVIGKIMHIFQYLKVGAVGIFQKYIRNNQGETELIVNDDIIEKNNVYYDIYEGGCGNQGASIVTSDYALYFVNPLKGHICRKSQDGVTILSILYKKQTWAGENLPKYLSSNPYQFGGDARVLGAFKIYKDKPGEYWLLAQGSPDVLTGETVTFDESKNGFCSDQDINADFIINAENTLYAFSNGMLWEHSNTNNYANFFGVQYKCSITLIFNDKVALKKKFLTVAYQATNFWTSDNIGDVLTSQPNPQTGLPQISNLISADFEVNEGGNYAALKYDANSNANPLIGLNEGDYLLGFWLKLKLTYNGSNFIYLYAPYITYILSPKNL